MDERVEAEPDGAAAREDMRRPRGAICRLLRFITCGSVDDGKSTLIGRLLYDSEAHFRGSARRARTRFRRSIGTRRRAISISRFWSTGWRPSANRASPSTSPIATSPRRSARSSSPIRPATSNTPATWRLAPRTADLAILLVDARKGVLAQTRRHAAIVSLLGIRHVVLAVNKIDLVDYRPGRFRQDRRRVQSLRRPARFREPCSRSRSRRGSATTYRTRARSTPWYRGPALIDYLETVDGRGGFERPAVPHAGAVGQPAASRFPRLCRHDRVSGTIRPGDRGDGRGFRPGLACRAHRHR